MFQLIKYKESRIKKSAMQKMTKKKMLFLWSRAHYRRRSRWCQKHCSWASSINKPHRAWICRRCKSTARMTHSDLLNMQLMELSMKVKKLRTAHVAQQRLSQMTQVMKPRNSSAFKTLSFFDLINDHFN